MTQKQPMFFVFVFCFALFCLTHMGGGGGVLGPVFGLPAASNASRRDAPELWPQNPPPPLPCVYFILRTFS